MSNDFVTSRGKKLNFIAPPTFMPSFNCKVKHMVMISAEERPSPATCSN